MSRLTIILVILAGAGYFIFKEIFKFKSGISATRSALNKAVSELTERLNALDLEPWDLDEMDLLSHDHSIEEYRNTFHVDYIGKWKSIYQEPILGIAERRYRDDEKYVVVIRLNDMIYHFTPVQERILLYKGEEQMGYILKEKPTELVFHNQALNIDTHSSADLFPASLNQRKVWSITKFDESLPLTRVIKELDTFTEDDGEKLVLVLSYAMMRQLI
jgi:hypothetical protein